MLYSVLAKFTALEDAVISPTRGYHAYAMFLEMLRRLHPEVAEQLHSQDSAKPFTISPLEGKFVRSKESLKLFEGESYSIRFTFLKDSLFAQFIDAAMKNSQEVLRLRSARLELHELLTSPRSSPWSDCHDPQVLLANAQENRQIKLQFLSPTVFRSKGKRNVLFPEPRLLFQSWLSRWESILTGSLHDGLLALAEKGTRISEYSLETRILHFSSYREIGFQGKCTLNIAEEIPGNAVRSLNALADFAFYCGTGAKTTMGMGQTRRLKDDRPVSRRTRSNASQG